MSLSPEARLSDYKDFDPVPLHRRDWLPMVGLVTAFRRSLRHGGDNPIYSITPPSCLDRYCGTSPWPQPEDMEAESRMLKLIFRNTTFMQYQLTASVMILGTGALLTKFL